MKTALLHTNNTSTLRVISILFIAMLSVTKFSAQTSVKTFEKNPIIIPAVHYEKSKSAALSSKQTAYSVRIAKNFPIIESGEIQVLNAMDVSENINYEQFFCSNTVRSAKKVDDSSLAVK